MFNLDCAKDVHTKAVFARLAPKKFSLTKAAAQFAVQNLGWRRKQKGVRRYPVLVYKDSKQRQLMSEMSHNVWTPAWRWRCRP